MAYGNKAKSRPQPDTAKGHRFLRSDRWISSPCLECGYGIEDHDEWDEWHQTESGMWYRKTPRHKA